MSSVEDDDGLGLLPPTLRAALEERGYETLTAVQQAVIDPALAGRDLRISSQTGSGKTVAVGIVLHPLLVDEEPREGGPVAIVITPTRELAAQVQKELHWLYAGDSISVVSVTGGTSVGAELRALRRGADVVVATPGRLLDHMERGAIDPRAVRAVVLDEADQMLDLGFREELEAIVEKLPRERRTLLMSATFSRDVISLANKYQRDAVPVQGTQLGVANVDIAHVVHPIVFAQRDDVVINLLLLAEGEPTLVFTRTRVDASELANKLSSLGFNAAALTGEMEQRERTRTLEAFRSGNLRTLIATDVAARGIDVAEVTRVIHADPPGDADVYTHRSGRTGRAGRKGTSVLLIAPAAREHAMRILHRARVQATWSPAPTARDVRKVLDAKLVEELKADQATDERASALAEALLNDVEPKTLVARLLARVQLHGACEPREVAAIEPRIERERRPEPRVPHRRGAPAWQERSPQPPPRAPFPRVERPADRPPPPPPVRETPHEGIPFVPFRVTWGASKGANPQRMLALVCRRGSIRGSDVGHIDIGDEESRVEVSAVVAEDFSHAVRRRDPRDPEVWIMRIEPGSRARHVARPAKHERGEQARPHGGDRPRRKPRP